MCLDTESIRIRFEEIYRKTIESIMRDGEETVKQIREYKPKVVDVKVKGEANKT